MDDPLLKNQAGGSPIDESPLASGLYEAGITNDQLNAVGIFFNDVYEKVRNKKTRQVTRNALTMLQGAIFALGSKEENVEWKEHCSSSLREIIHEWDGNGHDFCGEFREFYPNSPKATDTEAYKNFKSYYGYFSGIGHHNASGIMGSLKSLKKDSTLKLEDCYKDEVFLESVKGFFNLAFEIIEFSKKSPSSTPAIQP
jgi:hypothetical protein